MKLRQGFVSNSSSTSFMAGIPKGMTKKEKREFLIKKIGGENPSPLILGIVKDMADCILKTDPIKTKEELANYSDSDSFEDMLKKDGWRCKHTAQFFLKCLEKNLDFYEGSAGDENGIPGEFALHCTKCKVSDDDFLFFKEEDSY